MWNYQIAAMASPRLLWAMGKCTVNWSNWPSISQLKFANDPLNGKSELLIDIIPISNCCQITLGPARGPAAALGPRSRAHKCGNDVKTKSKRYESCGVLLVDSCGMYSELVKLAVEAWEIRSIREVTAALQRLRYGHRPQARGAQEYENNMKMMKFQTRAEFPNGAGSPSCVFRIFQHILLGSLRPWDHPNLFRIKLSSNLLQILAVGYCSSLNPTLLKKSIARLL
jgi:hypothetical protein